MMATKECEKREIMIWVIMGMCQWVSEVLVRSYLNGPVDVSHPKQRMYYNLNASTVTVYAIDHNDTNMGPR